jgi:hypothetical protein
LSRQLPALELRRAAFPCLKKHAAYHRCDAIAWQFDAARLKAALALCLACVVIRFVVCVVAQAIVVQCIQVRERPFGQFPHWFGQ